MIFRSHGKRGLFRRVFLHGLILIIAVVAAAGVIFVAFRPNTEHHHLIQQLANALASDLAVGSASQVKLEKRLEAIAFISKDGLAAYTENGNPLAAEGISPPPALSTKEAASLGTQPRFFRRHANTVLAVRIPIHAGGEAAYLLISMTRHGGHGSLLAALLVIVLVVGAVSFPLARSITKPVERLTHTAQRIGSGDLLARTGISRRDEVGVLAKTIDAMAAQLEGRIQREKELMADISHELRTPLARIKVALELCEEIKDTPHNLRDYLLGILNDASELERLIDDVLTISRLDIATQGAGGDLPLHLALVGLSELVNEAQARFAVNHPDCQLDVQNPPDAPVLNVDAALIKRLMDNLLDNAAKYSGDNAQIEMTARVKDEAVEIEVKDQGIGVDEKDLPRLFDPFYRTDRSRSRDIGGTGLGLALCKRIVESHGGTITALQRKKNGLKVRFTLPLHI
ncbi:MAG: HAMP domain-containing sensor histidine kinase [Myxococcota bacterium]|nr:HAMP domain-containing sensor histidine kinase [Myxococcota bacterium]